jgi:hypothetical protein
MCLVGMIIVESLLLHSVLFIGDNAQYYAHTCKHLLHLSEDPFLHYVLTVGGFQPCQTIRMIVLRNQDYSVKGQVEPEPEHRVVNVKGSDTQYVAHFSLLCRP